MYKQKNCKPNEWRNSAVIPVFKKDERKDPNEYTGISILDTCYKTSSKVLNKNCYVTQNSFCQKYKMDSEWDVHAQMQIFYFNYS